MNPVTGKWNGTASAELNDALTSAISFQLTLSRQVNLVFVPTYMPTMVSRNPQELCGLLLPESHEELHKAIDTAYVDGMLNIVTFIGGISALVMSSKIIPNTYGIARIENVKDLLF